MGVGKRAITSQRLRERPSEKVTKVGAFTFPPFFLSLPLLNLTIGWANLLRATNKQPY